MTISSMVSKLAWATFFFGLPILTVDSAAADTATLLSEHLCTKIADGHFDRIYIKSITVLRRDMTSSLLIFEGDKKHYVELSQITDSSMPLSLNDFQWNSKELREGVNAMVHKKRFNVSQVSAIYLINYGSPSVITGIGWPKGTWWKRPRFDSTALVVLLYTNSTLYSMNILPDFILSDKKIDLFVDHQNVYPNFALLQYQPEKTKTQGFVIHKDIYGLTDQLILYDMKYENLMETVDIHRKVKVSQKERDKAKYFYIEKGQGAGTVDLVPRGARSKNPNGDPSAQLVGSAVPRGFILNGKLYLMDTHAGCVYVIGGNIANLKLEEAYVNVPNKTLTYPVVGIPFESFFKCTGVSIAQPYPHPADRCEPRRNVAPLRRPLHGIDAESTDPFITVLLPVLLLLLLVLLLVGLCATAWWCFFGLSSTDDALLQDIDLRAVQVELKKRQKLSGKLGASPRDAGSSSVANEPSPSSVMHSKSTSKLSSGSPPASPNILANRAEF